MSTSPVLGNVGLGVLSLLLVLFSAWGSLALYYQLPWSLPVRSLAIAVYAVFCVACLVGIWRHAAGWSALIYIVSAVLLLSWWWQIKPSNEHDWEDGVAHMTHGVIHGDEVTVYNVRNFAWHSETDYDIRWETRTYNVNEIKSVDLVLSYWGMDAIAHAIVSFGFEDGRFLSFSVETRKTKEQEYSSVAGLFKYYGLSIVASDERDVIQVRPVYRGEDDYLYRLKIAPDVRKELFLAYIHEANELAEHPRFYNTVSGNCTTIVYEMMRHLIQDLPWDYRLLLTGYLPSYIQEQNGLKGKGDLAYLKEHGRITDKAKAAAGREDFSALIRQGVPGWSK